MHTADALPPLLLGVTQQISVVASHELLPHWMAAPAGPDELPELDPPDDDEEDDEDEDDLPPEDDELPLPDDELLLDDLPPDELPELDPPPELDEADAPPLGPSKSPSLVAPPHAPTANAASAPSAPTTMHPLNAMTAEPM